MKLCCTCLTRQFNSPSQGTTPMSDYSKLLMAAKELVAKPENWTKHAFFRTKDGAIVSSKSKGDDIHAFCVAGAVRIVYRRNPNQFSKKTYFGAVDILERHCLNSAMTVMEFNDDEKRTHAEVLMLLDDAIAKATDLEVMKELDMLHQRCDEQQQREQEKANA